MLRREFLDNGTLTHRANPCQSQPAHAWEKLSRVAAGKPQLLLTALAKTPGPHSAGLQEASQVASLSF